MLQPFRILPSLFLGGYFIFFTFVNVFGAEKSLLFPGTRFLRDSMEIIDLRKDKSIHIDSSLIQNLPESVVKVKPHSPHKATIYSLLLPGLGQIYNKQWWKVPILYGGMGATLYGILWNSSKYTDYRNAFVEYSQYLERKAVNENEPYPENPAWDKIPKSFDVEKYIGDNPQMQNWFKTTLKNRKDSFKRDRDLCYIIMGLIYTLNVIDADVFAHFFNYEINEDLSLRLIPVTAPSSGGGSCLGFSLRVNF